MPDTTKTSKGVIEFDLKYAVEKKKMSREEIEREIDKAEAKGYEVRIPRSQMGFLELYDEMSGRKRSGEWTTGKEMTNRALKAAPVAASFIPGVRGAALGAAAADLVTGQIRNKMGMGGPKSAGEALTSAATRGAISGGAALTGNLVAGGVARAGGHAYDRALGLTQELQKRFPDLDIAQIVRGLNVPFNRAGRRQILDRRAATIGEKNAMIEARDRAMGGNRNGISLADIWRRYASNVRRQSPDTRYHPRPEENEAFFDLRDEVHGLLSDMTQGINRPRPLRLTRDQTERAARQSQHWANPAYSAARAGRGPVIGSGPEHSALVARTLKDIVREDMPGLVPLDQRLQQLKAAHFAVLNASGRPRVNIGPGGVLGFGASPERVRQASIAMQSPATRAWLQAIPRVASTVPSYILAPSNEYWEKHPEEDE